MNTNSNTVSSTENNTVSSTENVTVLPPVLEPKKRNRRPLTEEEKNARKEKSMATREKREKLEKEFRKEAVKSVRASLTPEEQEEILSGSEYSFKMFSERVDEKVKEMVKNHRESFKKAKREKNLAKADPVAWIIRKYAELTFDINSSLKILNIEVEKSAFDSAVINGVNNPVRRASRNRSKKNEK